MYVVRHNLVLLIWCRELRLPSLGMVTTSPKLIVSLTLIGYNVV